MFGAESSWNRGKILLASIIIFFGIVALSTLCLALSIPSLLNFLNLSQDTLIVWPFAIFCGLSLATIAMFYGKNKTWNLATGMSLFALAILGLTLGVPDLFNLLPISYAGLITCSLLTTCVSGLTAIGISYKGEWISALIIALSVIALTTFGLALFNPSLLAFLSISQTALIATSLTVAFLGSVVAIIMHFIDVYGSTTMDRWYKLCSHDTRKAAFLASMEIIVGLALLLACGFLGLNDIFNFVPLDKEFNPSFSIFQLELSINCLALISSALLMFVGYFKLAAVNSFEPNITNIKESEAENSIFQEADNLISSLRNDLCLTCNNNQNEERGDKCNEYIHVLAAAIIELETMSQFYDSTFSPQPTNTSQRAMCRSKLGLLFTKQSQIINHLLQKTQETRTAMLNLIGNSNTYTNLRTETEKSITIITTRLQKVRQQERDGAPKPIASATASNSVSVADSSALIIYAQQTKFT